VIGTPKRGVEADALRSPALFVAAMVIGPFVRSAGSIRHLTGIEARRRWLLWRPESGPRPISTAASREPRMICVSSSHQTRPLAQF
jgi:hypothetical protein